VENTKRVRNLPTLLTILRTSHYAGGVIEYPASHCIPFFTVGPKCKAVSEDIRKEIKSKVQISTGSSNLTLDGSPQST